MRRCTALLFLSLSLSALTVYKLAYRHALTHTHTLSLSAAERRSFYADLGKWDRVLQNYDQAIRIEKTALELCDAASLLLRCQIHGVDVPISPYSFTFTCINIFPHILLLASLVFHRYLHIDNSFFPFFFMPR
jgi:hypothetical protein